MKYSGGFLIVCLVLASINCQLADGGRKASLEISIAQPDIYRSLSIEDGSSSSRILFSETKKIELVLYKPFEADLMPQKKTTGAQPSQTDFDALVSRQDSRFIEVYPSSVMGVTINVSDLEPGTWNIVCGTFQQVSDDWILMTGAPNTITYNILLDVEISSGVNSVPVPLIPNIQKSFMIQADVNDTTASATSLDFTRINGPYLISITNIPSGVCRLLKDTSIVALPTASAILFYDQDGYLIEPSYISGASPYWEFNVAEANSTISILFYSVTDVPGGNVIQGLYYPPTPPIDKGSYNDIGRFDINHST